MRNNIVFLFRFPVFSSLTEDGVGCSERVFMQGGEGYPLNVDDSQADTNGESS